MDLRISRNATGSFHPCEASAATASQGDAVLSPFGAARAGNEPDRGGRSGVEFADFPALPVVAPCAVYLTRVPDFAEFLPGTAPCLDIRGV